MKKNRQLWVLILVIALCVPAAFAQQKDPRVNSPVAPLPPLPGGESSSRAAADATGQPAAPQNTPAPPLTSTEGRRLGQGSARDYFLPSLSLYQGGDSNAGNIGSGRGLSSVSSVSGDMAFHRVWGRNEFTGIYSGGANFYASASDLNSWYQQFQFTQKMRGRRWTFLFGDMMDYRQDPFGGFGGLGNVPGGLGGGIASSNLNSALLPNQTILTGRVPRISNTAHAEWQYQASRRSSFTVNGAYGMLHYFEAGLSDTNNTTVGAGYNYAMTGRDTLAVSYGVNMFRFPDFDQKTDTHTVYVTYGRLISGRLAFEVGAGPQVALVDRGAAGSSTLTSWSMQSSLRYRWAKSTFGLFYDHSVTGGSGYFLSARTDNVGASWTQQLSRIWAASWDFGYGHNKPLSSIGSGTTMYGSWRGGVRLTRPLGRTGMVSFNYHVEHQTADIPGGCVGPGCGLIGTRHVFGVGFNFRFRPIDIE